MMILILPCCLAVGAFALGLSPQTDAQNAPVKIYTAGPGVTAPELLPETGTHAYQNDHCRDQLQGKVTFSVIVDASGDPKNIYFLSPIGDDLDLLALKAVREDHFKPGAKDGSPVAVAESVEVSLRTCLRDAPDANGRASSGFFASNLP